MKHSNMYNVIYSAMCPKISVKLLVRAEGQGHVKGNRINYYSKTEENKPEKAAWSDVGDRLKV